MLAALALFAAATGASTINIDFAAAWKDPTGRVVPDRSPRIEPVWSRINIWLPWMRWDPAQPATLPVFEPFVREAALIMATGARPDAPVSVPDLYQDSSGAMKGFDPAHPFFTALKLFKQRGIRPVIDIGPVPAALSPGGKAIPKEFQWNVAGPADQERHYAYLKTLFLFLQSPGMFTRAEVESWGWQLWREPDNKDSWNPAGATRHADMKNLDFYERTYDCALAAMRDAGLNAPLAPGNLMLPFPGSLGFASDSWTVPLLDWLAKGPNRCPDHLALPRFRPGRDTLVFGFSAYGGVAESQIGTDPRKLASIVDKLRYAATRAFPATAVRIVVAEGNLMDGGLLNRSDGTARGGAWNAAIWKIAHDEGLYRYQQWGFVGGDHISRFMEHGGLPSAPHNVAELYRKLQGEPRRPALIVRGKVERMGAYLDAIASGTDSLRHVLLFRVKTGVIGPGIETAEVKLAGLKPGAPYALRRYRVDPAHASYIEAWRKDLGGKGMKIEFASDALMGFQFAPEHKVLWEKRKADYARIARLAPLAAESGDMATADGTGVIGLRVNMPANSVFMAELRPAPASRRP